MSTQTYSSKCSGAECAAERTVGWDYINVAFGRFPIERADSNVISFEQENLPFTSSPSWKNRVPRLL